MTEKENLVNMVWRVDENIITVSGIDVSKEEIKKVTINLKFLFFSKNSSNLFTYSKSFCIYYSILLFQHFLQLLLFLP